MKLKNLLRKAAALLTAATVLTVPTGMALAESADDFAEASSAAFSVAASDEDDETASVAASAILAFPGAEGAGKYATGGRGGTIYHVTNLNDSGTGSFRDAVSSSNRIVVFDVGGTVELSSAVVVKSNITILGQTAPGGGGITLKGGYLGQGGSNQIIRFVSSRPGEMGKEEFDAWGGSDGSKSIVDHCSIGWGNDEMWGLYSNNDYETVQYSIIGPSNCISTHSKGAHGFGIMFGKGYVSWHHNMIAHNISRNFRGKNTSPSDFVNNVIYDWGYQTGYGTLGQINYVGNYLKGGNSTSGSYHYFSKSSGSNYESYKFYITGNKIVDKNGNDKISGLDANNWLGVDGFDYATYGVDTPTTVYDASGNDVTMAADAESADDAFANVLAYAGAGINAESRPKIDQQVMEEAENGTGYLTGTEVDTTTDSTLLSAISSYKIQDVDYDDYYPEAVSKTITDSDNDGMPDDWELQRGLDPNDASDATGDYLGEGYMNIEYYANDLTVDAFPAGVVEESPVTADLGEDYNNAKEDLNAISLSPTTIKSASDLTLPQTGSIYGTAISWASSSSAVKISNNQISSVSRDEDDKTVTLTATVTAGDYTLKKTFTITVTGSSAFWKASADVTAGSEVMDGLTALFDGTYKSSSITTDDITFSGYLTGTESGNFSNGEGSGTAFKFVAPSDGSITVYVTRLGSAADDPANEGNGKILYITPATASSRDESIASIKGYGISTCVSANVTAGETYYIYVAGSKGCFNGIKFLEGTSYENTEVMAGPGLWDFGDEPFVVDGIPNTDYFPEGATEGRYDMETDSITAENFSGLTFTTAENIGNAYASTSKTFEDGFTSTWQIKSSGTGSESDRYFSFYPSEDGIITVYAQSGSSGTDRTLVITQGGNSNSMTLVATNNQATEYPTGILPSLSLAVTAGTQVKVYGDGNTGFMAIGYYNENYELDPDATAKPTSTPKPTVEPTVYEETMWDFGSEPFTVTEEDGTVHPDTNYFPAGSSDGRYDITSTSITDSSYFNGLTYTTSATSSNGYQGSVKTFEDGFVSSWQLKSNGAGSSSDRVFTFVPAYAGTVKVYARSGSGSTAATLTISQGSLNTTHEYPAATKGDDGSDVDANEDGTFPIVSLDVNAGAQVKIYSSANTSYYAIAYVPEETIVVPTAEPSATPTAEPSATPAAEPSATPTTEPSAIPTTEPANYSYTVNSITKTDSGVTVNVTSSDASETVKVIVAVYDGTSGALTGISLNDVTISAGESKDIAASVAIPDGSTVKAFIWDSETGIKPLSEYKEM